MSGSNANYSNVTLVAGVLNIGKATLTITGASGTPVTYNGQVQTNTYTVTGLQGSVDSASSIGLVVSGSASQQNVGTYSDTLSATVTSGNYSVVTRNGSL